MADIVAQTQLHFAGRRLLKRNGQPPVRLPRAPAPRPPLQQENAYFEELQEIIRAMLRVVQTVLLPQLPILFRDQQFQRPTDTRQDAPADEIDGLFQQVFAKVDEAWTPEQLKELARRKGVSLEQYNKEAIRRNLRRVVGVDVLSAEPWVAQELSIFTINNANLIQSMKDDGISAVEKQTYAALQQGIRHEELAKQIEQYLDPEEGPVASRAKLIARDQISKLNGQMNQLRQSDLGISRYRWRTVGDERVRDSHRENDGKIFSWDEPPETGHPGEDYQCRCWAEPVLEDVVPGMAAPEDQVDE